MQDPFAQTHSKDIPSLRFTRALTRTLITFENFVAAFWRLITFTLFFLSVWFFELPDYLGPFGYEIAAVLFFGGFGYFLYLGFKDYKRPTDHQVIRRIEQHNNLLHRPITTLDDNLANPDKPATRSLWQSYKARVKDTLARLKTPSYRSDILKSDPYALRFAVFFLFVASVFFAHGDWGPRLKNGLMPFSIYKLPGYDLESATITVTPPAYTNITPFVLKGRTFTKSAHIPEGSVIKAQVNGGIGIPHLHIGDMKYPMERLDGKSYGLEYTIREPGSLSLSQFYVPRLHWPYHLVTDKPPLIALNGEVEETAYSSLQIPLSVFDDYGVQDVSVTLHLDPIVQDAPLGDIHHETRAVMSPALEETQISPVYDFTAHVWAGLPAILRLSALDGSGQISSVDIPVVLPEREFKHPLAKKLIEHRKALAWSPEGEHEDIRDSLYRLQTHPDDYNHDIVVLMALRTAAARLYFSPGTPTAKALIDLFWDVAVHLEDGDLNLALRQLQEAQRELEQALSDPDASEQEIAQLVEELRQAMANYFKEMAREMQKRMAEGQDMFMMSPEMFSQMLDADQLAQFFDQLQAEALDNPQKARELLSQLNKLLDMMNPSFAQTMPQDMQMMQEGVSELQQLVRRQEELLDQTRDQANIQESGEDIDTEKNRAEQEALRYILGQLMLDADAQIGEIPESMGLAEQEMRQAAENLEGNNPGGAIPHQEQALEYLRDAMQDLSQQLMARMQQMMGFTLGQGKQDPLGRPMPQGENGNSFFGSTVEIPDEAERKKIEEILRELREKSGEYERPREEREYYRRLLKQF